MHCTAAREVSSASASGSRQQRSAVCGVRHNFQNYMQYGAKTKERFCASLNTKNIAASNTRLHQNYYFLCGNSLCDLRAGPTRKVIRRALRLCNAQNTHAPLRQNRGCQNTCLYIPPAYVCRSVLSREHWRMALSKLGKIYWKGRGGSDRLGPC